MRVICLAFSFILFASGAHAFCGFFVAKADGSLYNESSKVVYVRDGRKSVITMSADYRGPAKDFAMVIPTPRVLREGDIRTVDASIVNHLDDYTAPRLVEYFDYDPCNSDILMEPEVVIETVEESSSCGIFGCRDQRKAAAQNLGVTIQGEYAIDAYDVLILSAEQSGGLATFLTNEGYKLPNGAEAVLADYIGAGMKFFVARVNLERHAAGESQELKPLQISFKSRDFMLPIQLGKLNAEESQDALFFMLTRSGRVELANYGNRSIPADENIPSFVEEMFPYFYRSMFNKTVGSRGGIVMEYAWDMSWCDPCAADPLSNKDLATLGVGWLKEGSQQGQDVYVTRFHAQYTKGQMMKDPAFRVTENRQNFQGRYIMNQPFVGDVSCEAGKEYVQQKRLDLRQEAVRLAEMTGWSPRKIEDRIRKSVPASYW